MRHGERNLTTTGPFHWFAQGTGFYSASTSWRFPCGVPDLYWTDTVIRVFLYCLSRRSSKLLRFSNDWLQTHYADRGIEAFSMPRSMWLHMHVFRIQFEHHGELGGEGSMGWREEHDWLLNTEPKAPKPCQPFT